MQNENRRATIGLWGRAYAANSEAAWIASECRGRIEIVVAELRKRPGYSYLAEVPAEWRPK